MSVPPRRDDDDRTVMMPAREVVAAPAESALSRPARTHLRAFSAVAGIMLLAMIAGSLLAGGAFFLLRGTKPFAVPSQPPHEAAPARPAQEAAPAHVEQPADLPAPPPPASTRDRPFSPRQMLNEIFEARNRGHSVTASVDRGKVRIRSSRPGYLYVLAAGANKLDLAVLFVAVLYPGAADTNNRIEPGQTLELADTQWPANAEFLAIVSDEPRDFGALGPMAGKVTCDSPAPCSESYGAVVFASAAASAETGTRGAARSPALPKAPATSPTDAVSRRCSDMLERASLGEVLTADEYTFLRRDCR
jgi:hypothetical protein